ncbi:MAG: Abortive infection protein, partial [Pedosphaera sp.]|nr:Abortive infection protein [Pedosphaera sp.]
MGAATTPMESPTWINLRDRVGCVRRRRCGCTKDILSASRSAGPMDPNDIPPLIDPPAPEPEPAPTLPRWRWWLHLLVLAAFPLLVGALSYSHADDRTTPLLPTNVVGLLSVSVRELLFFGALFAIAWLASRVNGRQLLLKWRGVGQPVLWGLGYSIILRVAIAVLVSIAVVFWLGIKGTQLSTIQQGRPHVEQLVNATALTQNPLYFFLTLTLISFVVAGLREELWRAGMLAGMNALFPQQFATNRGRFFAVSVAAVIFGLGHTAQGWSGVAITAFLGLGLGAIMLRHRSIWEAV